MSFFARGVGTAAGADNTLLDVTGRVAATVPTFSIVAIASRAFAADYALQAVLALRTSEGTSR